jgi:hypothetical protein
LFFSFPLAGVGNPAQLPVLGNRPVCDHHSPNP